MLLVKLEETATLKDTFLSLQNTNHQIRKKNIEGVRNSN